jgi:IclR family transcriptional regulator, acetate operon repressor
MNTTMHRGLRAMQLVGAATDGLTLAQISREIGAPRSSMHVVLKALTEMRFLEHSPDGRYRLGLGALEVGAAYLAGVTPVRAARPELAALSRDLLVTAHFAVLDNGSALYLDKSEPENLAVRLVSAIGARLPAQFTAVGKACLAYGSEDALSLLDLQAVDSARRFVDAVALGKELELVRGRGYAVDEGRTTIGVNCVAAPVFDDQQRCQGAVGVSYLRRGGPTVKTCATAVVTAARRISTRLGSRDISA